MYTGRKTMLAISAFLLFTIILTLPTRLEGQRTQKPALHGKHWMAITGKPLAATAGSMIFQKGGNAVDAACAMIAATSTMWDTLSWGGETQALIYNPHTGKVIGINALGVAPSGATAEFYKSKGMKYPPEYGPEQRARERRGTRSGLRGPAFNRQAESARRDHARHTRRHFGDACGVRQA